jgi:hypothetical protein
MTLPLQACAKEMRNGEDVDYFLGLSLSELPSQEVGGYVDVHINDNFVKRFSPAGTVMIDKFLRASTNSLLIDSSCPQSCELTVVKMVGRETSTVLVRETISGLTTSKFELVLQELSLNLVPAPLLTKEQTEEEITHIVASIYEMIKNTNATSLARVLLEGEKLRSHEDVYRRGKRRWMKVLGGKSFFVPSTKLNFVHGSDLVFVYSGEQGSEEWKKTLLFENRSGAALSGIHFARYKDRWIVW